ncbi:GH92 family glycosyl hydrolase [Oleiagrimonas soli]|uniref:Alpha-mannosidase n=1 Tax=Oleiagrimonas soli TaxID=1543381 RepID=A0A099CZV1_9GAMM|nr:GH92 family glycosyl hydrolase [Oleiagrimonas soli]KGI79112.1 alpha-mannosidase [Oleiagrimonas soli]MBB6184666.1 putative alpha-1,2-mannosidase [Oleiagrimonas soli]
MPTRRGFLQGAIAFALFAGADASGLARALPGVATKGDGDMASTHPFCDRVDLFIGTGGHGHTYPGATRPFGMVQLSPDTYNADWDACSGYHLGDGSIMGFSHTHLSGTGASDMLDVLVMPATGPTHIAPGTRKHPESGYRSRYDHADEVARPGYYAVLLKDYGIRAELTATERAGIHRYHFPAGHSGHLVIDWAHGIQDADDKPTRVTDADLKLVDDRTVTGGRRVHQWANGRYIHFAMRLSRPFAGAQLYAEDQPLAGLAREAKGKCLKAVLRYPDAHDAPLLVKVGISAVSAENAMRNLDAEIPAWDFDGVRRDAADAWERELSRVDVDTPSAADRRTFYTALYHTMLAPTLFDDVDRRYRGMDLKVHTLPEGAHNYSTYSLWDTYRALHPLMTLVQPERVPSLVDGLIRLAEESPDGVPVWPLQGVETGCMIGWHSAAVIAEAYAKGFTGVDYAKAWKLYRQRAMEDDYRGLPYYRKLGYVPCDKDWEGVSKTLEYAYCDWSSAHLARAAGDENGYRALLKRSRNYANVFNHDSNFMQPRLADGAWATPFDPRSVGHSKKWRDYTESNAWQATFLNQHDVHHYMTLFGGTEAFARKLDALFNASSELPADAPPDIAGLIGQYAHGNEPSHHIAYLYAYAGQHHKTQARVRQILRTLYHAQPDGLAGNEDCGQMSAWYVLSAMGFYPVDPVSGNYVIGSPLFDRVTMQVGKGRTLTVEAKGNGPERPYIQSVTFNGKPYTRTWLRHADLAAGGTLVFEMGAKPNLAYGAAPADRPPSFV